MRSVSRRALKRKKRFEKNCAVTHHALVQRLERVPEAGVHVVEVPLEGVALEVAAQALAGGQVLGGHLAGRDALAAVVDVPVVVHPHLGAADRVLLDDVDARLPLVGRAVAEHVAHAAARHREQAAAAHPDAERHLQVLAAPDLHAYAHNSRQELSLVGE